MQAVQNVAPSINFGCGVTPKSNFFKPVRNFFNPFLLKYNKMMNFVTKKIAVGVAGILKNKTVSGFISKTKNADLVSHLSALTGIVLSGFYMKKTLENDKLDSNKRRTLAINQGVVCALSTVLAYSFDSLTNKKVNQFIDRFQAINVNRFSEKNLSKYVEGIKAAKKMMIFSVMYRFIAPVFATPIANSIGNHIQANKEAKLAEAKLAIK